MYQQQSGECTVSWCDRDARTRGYCKTCYARMVKGYDPEVVPKFQIHRDATPEERMQHAGWVVTESGCWEWSGQIDKKGYGVLTLRGKHKVFAHRMAYTLWVGEIPEGLFILHSCDNPPCINPDHLRPGTHRENVDDMVAKGRAKTVTLSPEDVLEIRRRSAEGESFQQLAVEFRVGSAAIWKTVTGKSWKHV